MYAAAVAVPLIIGGALKLPKEQIAFLISADLFVSGLITLVQCVGMGWFGIRQPIMMGVSFTGIGAMIAIASKPEMGLPGLFGSMLVAGALGIAMAPLMGRLMRFFPQLVVGTILLTIGVSLLDVGVHWMGGGFDVKDFGNPEYIAISIGVLLLILILSKYTTGFINNVATLIGIVAGLIVCAAMGLANFDAVAEAPWFGLVLPFHYGAFKVDFWSVVTMSIVMLVNMIETGGVFLALGEMVERPVNRNDMVKGFRADGLGTLMGAMFNTFPYTSYSENIGLMVVTGVRSRWVVAAGACILIVLALLPKMSAVVAAVPVYVLGGVGLVMFGMIAVAGIRMLRNVDFDSAPLNGFVVAISVGVGMIPVLAPKFFDHFPKELSPLLQSGIVLGAITAILLNIFFNGSAEESLATERNALESVRT